MGRAGHTTYIGEVKPINKILQQKNFEGRAHLGDEDLDERIILEWYKNTARRREMV
jgi:hypothetical protein